MSTANSDIIFEVGGRRRELAVLRHAKARSLKLRVDPRDGRVVLTLPKRSSVKRAIRWAESKRGWVEEELAKLPTARPIEPGGSVPFRGEGLRIDWALNRSRRIAHDAERLLVGGPEAELSNRVIRWLKTQARERLRSETQLFAEKAGVAVSKVSIGDARTRWGSCSSSGGIRYSWRLIMSPPDVLSATVAHEVAHRVHMNHGRAFHTFVAELFGRDPAPERRWLREHGPSLYWVGVSS